MHPSANQSAKRLRKTKELCENQAGAHTKNKDANKPWWEILEVPQCAPKEVIQKAFREKILRYHPDRLESLGEEFRKLAEEKAKELFPGTQPDVERIRHTEKGGPDKWRKE